MTDSPEVQFVEGIAQILTDAGIGVYSTSGVYGATDVGIVFGGVAEYPDEQIALTSYIVSDDPPPSNNTVLGLQVQQRGTTDPRSVWNRSGLIFNQLQGLARVWFGDLFLVEMWRQTGRLDGKDANNRWLTSESYYARVNWATQYRTE